MLPDKQIEFGLCWFNENEFWIKDELIKLFVKIESNEDFKFGLIFDVELSNILEFKDDWLLLSDNDEEKRALKVNSFNDKGEPLNALLRLEFERPKIWFVSRSYAAYWLKVFRWGGFSPIAPNLLTNKNVNF